MEKFADTRKRFNVLLSNGKTIKNARVQSVVKSEPILTYKVNKDKFWVSLKEVESYESI